MWKKLTITGSIAAAFYLTHIILGGILWKDYSHLMQPISDLTASGAPNRALLSIFTTLYGIFALTFSISAYAYLKGFRNRPLSAGMLLFIIMHTASLSYGFFPEDLPGTTMTLTGLMHLIVTAVIVPFAIASPLLTGIGFIKLRRFKRYGYYSIFTSCILFLFGGLSVVFAVYKLPYFGLIERINIGALQIWMLVLSIKLFTFKESFMIIKESRSTIKRKKFLMQRLLPLFCGALLALIEIKLFSSKPSFLLLLPCFLLGVILGLGIYHITEDVMSICWMTFTAVFLPALGVSSLFLMSPSTSIDYSLTSLILSNWLSINLPCFLLRIFSAREKGMSDFEDYSKSISIQFMITYFLLMCWMLFSSSFSSREGQKMINLIPFKTITLYITGAASVSLRTVFINLIGNVILFIPLGFYVKGLIKNLKWSLLALIGIPVMIECIQYILAAGISDIDDVILNILGELIGLLLLAGINAMYRWKNKYSHDGFLGF